MDVLNSATLTRAFRMCDEDGDTNICIGFKNLWSVDDFTDFVRVEISVGRMKGWNIIGQPHRGYAVLKAKSNGLIHLMNAQNASLFKSRFFQWVLYEEGVNYVTLQTISGHEQKKEECGTELDDFLKNFKIIRCRG